MIKQLEIMAMSTIICLTAAVPVLAEGDIIGPMEGQKVIEAVADTDYGNQSKSKSTDGQELSAEVDTCDTGSGEGEVYRTDEPDDNSETPEKSAEAEENSEAAEKSAGTDENEQEGLKNAAKEEAANESDLMLEKDDNGLSLIAVGKGTLAVNDDGSVICTPQTGYEITSITADKDAGGVRKGNEIPEDDISDISFIEDTTITAVFRKTPEDDNRGARPASAVAAFGDN